jgi:hypothetical protein
MIKVREVKLNCSVADVSRNHRHHKLDDCRASGLYLGSMPSECVCIPSNEPQSILI